MTDIEQRAEELCEHGIPKNEECDACYLGSPKEHRRKQRIAVAKIMGWRRESAPYMDSGEIVEGWVQGDNYPLRHAPPNPFTDANDDYAVLEWARNTWMKHDYDTWDCFWDEVEETGARAAYKIGDYARALLKAHEEKTL